MSKYLLHVGKREISDKLNDYPPFVFPPNTAVLIQDDFIAGKILEHKRLEGLVEVQMSGMRDGFPQFDVDGAKIQAAKALKIARKELVERYVKTQREFRIRKNLPPLPPSPVVSEIIAEDGIDLAAMGVNIIGAGFALPTIPNQSADMISMQAEMDNLKEMLKQLAENNRLLMAQMQQPKEQARKGQ